MSRFSIWVAAAVFCGLALAVRASAADGQDNPPPPKQDGGAAGPGGGGAGGPGGPGGRPPAGFHLIPRFAEDKLNLTDDQKKQIADLEKDVKDKLAKILTPEQMKTLEEARPPRPGGRGGPGPGGGQGGPGGGGPGGQAGPNGAGDANDQPPRPPRPPAN